MIINIHAGHNPDGTIACGAVGLIKESTEARKVKSKVISLLNGKGHTVYDCTCDNGINSNDVLKKIVAKCNAHKVDLDVSIHFNAGGGHGVEVLQYNSGTDEVATRICKSISSLGFRNRGIKKRPELYALKNTKAQAILIECCFVESKEDTSIYQYSKMAQAIVDGIIGTSSSFKVKVNVDSLNIRKGASVSYEVVGKITDKGTYTIIEESNGWGKLKSGVGWINLKYTTRKN